MLDLSERGQDYRDRMLAFMDEHVYPAESVYREQMRASGDANHHPQVLEDLKAEARSRGLWNLFHPHPEWGPGLTNLEYAHLAEIRPATAAARCPATPAIRPRRISARNLPRRPGTTGWRTCRRPIRCRSISMFPSAASSAGIAAAT